MAGTSHDAVIFFKFHKVGSSTVGGTVRLALIASTGNVFASCLRVSKLRNKTATERARYTHCSLCAKHDNSLVLLPFFRAPSVLAAPPSTRLAALFASAPHAAKTLDEFCPMRASMANTRSSWHAIPSGVTLLLAARSMWAPPAASTATVSAWP